MTAPKSTTRPRRRTSAEDLPLDLVAWFEGKRREDSSSGLPWSALIWPDYALLPDRWKIWKAAHPDARPPAGYEWLDDPKSPHRQPAWMLDLARKAAKRPLKRSR